MANQRSTLTKRPSRNGSAKSKAQIVDNRQTIGGFSFGVGNPPGFGRPPQGSFEIWRLMRTDPTVALGFMFATAPIRDGKWTYHEDGAPAGALDFIEQTMATLKDDFCRDASLGLMYGFSPFEKVFTVKDGRLTLERLKPLLVDFTTILISTATGEMVGLLNKPSASAQTVIPSENVFLYSHDAEAGDLYGRSRFENIRTVWWDNKGIAEHQGQFATKVSSIVPILHYPPGDSTDEFGSSQDNHEIAQKILNSLSTASGVAICDAYLQDAWQLAGAGVPMKDLQQWRLEFVEAENTDHASPFVLQRSHFEKLMLRGLGVPERVLTEGSTGTKAEAETHSDTALMLADITVSDLMHQVNSWIVDQLLMLNFGMEAKGTVWIRSEPLADERRSIMKSLLHAAMQNNPEFMSMLLDFGAMAKEVDLPTLEGADPLSILEQLEQDKVDEQPPSEEPEEAPTDG